MIPPLICEKKVIMVQIFNINSHVRKHEQNAVNFFQKKIAQTLYA